MQYKFMDLLEVAQEVKRHAEVKRDFMVHNASIEVYPNLSLELGESVSFLTNDTFRQQLAAHFNIPQAYAERMIRDNPALYAENINSWLELNRAERRLVRTLDGTARCFASDKYRPIDNYEVVDNAMDEILNHHANLKFADCDVTPDRLYLKVMNPSIRAEIQTGDVVESGMIIRNSEVSRGSLSVVPYVNRLVCTNGMVINEMGKRQRHIGTRFEEDFSTYTERTVQLDNATIMSKLRDIIRLLISDAAFTRVVETIRESAGLTLPQDAPLVRFTELANQAFGIRADESESVLERFLSTANTSRSIWDYGNAVTAEAHRAQDYDRAISLQTIGWEIVSDPKRVEGLIAQSYYADTPKRRKGNRYSV
jgi:hypothetical protein